MLLSDRNGDETGQGSDLRISEAICEKELSVRFPQDNP